MYMQVILDSLFARPSPAPIWGGKKWEFRDWTSWPLTLRFCIEDRFSKKCSLILSSETLTSLYFASRIRPQCCMLHVLKSEVFIWGGVGGRRSLGPFFLNFLDPPLDSESLSVYYDKVCCSTFSAPSPQKSLRQSPPPLPLLNIARILWCVPFSRVGEG